MAGSSAIFLIGLGAMALAVAGLCLFGYDISTTRERLRQRVDLLGLARRVPTLASGGRSPRASGASSWVTATVLQGNELELARRLEPFHIPADFAPRMLLLMRLSAGVVLGMAFLLLGYRYGGIRTMWSLAAAGSLGAAFGWLIPAFAVGRLARSRRRAIARAWLTPSSFSLSRSKPDCRWRMR